MTGKAPRDTSRVECGYAYVIRNPRTGLYKLGCARQPFTRLRSLSRELCIRLELGGYTRALARHAADRLRDIFGNPFRPVAFSPEWRTDTAVLLARQMYDARDFGAMPILADALQDAGCDSDDVLQHCRDPRGTHVRGCWVCDLVLGKE